MPIIRESECFMKQTKLIVFLMLLVILASLIPSGAMAA